MTLFLKSASSTLLQQTRLSQSGSYESLELPHWSAEWHVYAKPGRVASGIPADGSDACSSKFKHSLPIISYPAYQQKFLYQNMASNKSKPGRPVIKADTSYKSPSMFVYLSSCRIL